MWVCVLFDLYHVLVDEEGLLGLDDLFSTDALYPHQIIIKLVRKKAIRYNSKA